MAGYYAAEKYGDTYENLLQNVFFKPLGMNSTQTSSKKKNGKKNNK